QSRASWDARFDARYAERASAWGLGHNFALDVADSLSAISVLQTFQDEGEHEASSRNGAATAWELASIGEWDKPAFAEGAPSRQVALPHADPAALPMLEAASIQVSATPDVPASLLAFEFLGNAAHHSAELVAASQGGLAPISFDPSTGQLAIRSNAE